MANFKFLKDHTEWNITKGMVIGGSEPKGDTGMYDVNIPGIGFQRLMKGLDVEITTDPVTPPKENVVVAPVHHKKHKHPFIPIPGLRKRRHKHHVKAMGTVATMPTVTPMISNAPVTPAITTPVVATAASGWSADATTPTATPSAHAGWFMLIGGIIGLIAVKVFRIKGKYGIPIGIGAGAITGLLIAEITKSIPLALKDKPKSEPSDKTTETQKPDYLGGKAKSPDQNIEDDGNPPDTTDTTPPLIKAPSASDIPVLLAKPTDDKLAQNDPNQYLDNVWENDIMGIPPSENYGQPPSDNSLDTAFNQTTEDVMTPSDLAMVSNPPKQPKKFLGITI